MKTSVTIAKIFGIPVKLHISFLIILPLFIGIFAINEPPWGFSSLPYPENYLLSTLATILLFASILLHEIAHSIIAVKKGVKIKSITLMLFGGVASMEESPRDPESEALISFSGPFMSFLLAFFFYFLQLAHPFTKPLFQFLFFINIILALFNLIPAFPMDGGRILRALLARRMSFVQATKKAVEIGKMIAIFMAFFGLFYNLWLFLIAFFVYIAATEEERATETLVIFEGLRVRDIMSENVSSVPPELSVEELLKKMFEEKHMGYPVLEGENLVGIVTFEDARRVPFEKRNQVRVSDIMSRKIMVVSPEEPLSSVVRRMSEGNFGRVPVVDEEGRLIGIVTRTDILKSLQLLMEMRRV
ncbi:MAG: CBS domain-containing protein [Archaeoglobi archaeon]|nr:CBS domain-containing protein [Candidatus Mnemosynella sp.]